MTTLQLIAALPSQRRKLHGAQGFFATRQIPPLKYVAGLRVIRIGSIYARSSHSSEAETIPSRAVRRFFAL